MDPVSSSFLHDDARPNAIKGDRWWPVLVFSAVCALVLGAQLVRYSPLKPLWIDEILSYYQVDGRSPAAAAAALDTGVNLLPPGYFWLLAEVVQYTGFSPLIARGLSCAFIIATVPVMLLTLRRYVGIWFAMVAVTAVVFRSPLIFFHNTEARPYGMTLFFVALIALAFARSTENKTLSVGRLTLLVAANGLVAMTTYFGGLYSASAFAVTLLLDWRRGWFRPRVYLCYLVGWAIFAVTTLPLCLRQLAANGATGTDWLPSFGYAWRHLFTQWRSVLWGVAPIAVALGLVLWIGRSSGRSVTGVISNSRWKPIRGLAALAGLWLLLPIVFIVQSRITGRNFYFDRYFIGSELGLVIALAVGGALLCQWLGGAPALEQATWRRAAFGLAAKILVVGFIGLAAIKFSVHQDPPQMGPAGPIAEVEKWALPKATFDFGFYVQGSYPPKERSRYWYIAHSERQANDLERFYRGLQVKRERALPDFPEFIFIESSRQPADFSLETWARDNRRRLTKVGDYRDGLGRVKTFYLVQGEKAAGDKR